MKIEDVKKNLNKMVEYKGIQGVYRLTACILRKSGNGYRYTAELLDARHGNSVLICDLDSVTAQEGE